VSHTVVAAPRTDRGSAERTTLDRFLALVPVACIALVVLMILFWEAATRKTPTVFTDELEWSQISRAIAATGHAARRGEPVSFKSLYAYLIAPCWWLHSTATAYTVIKYVNAVVMSLAAVPVYLLARRLVSVPAAWAAAILSLCTSAFFYMTLIMPEVLAYPWSCLCAYLSFRALSGDGRRWTISAVVACLVAIEVRGELICAGAALVLAAIGLWLVGPTSRRIRRGWSVLDHLGAGLLLVGVLIVLNRIVSGHATEWAYTTQNWRGRIWHLGFEAGSALAIGLGVLPAIAGLASLHVPERRMDPRWRAFAALLAASIVTFGTYTGVKAAYLSTQFGTYVEERNLIYLGPLLLVGAAVWFSARRGSLASLAAAGAFVGWLLLAYGYQLGYPYGEAPGYGIAAFANRVFHWDQPHIHDALAVTLAVSLLLALVPLVRRVPTAGRIAVAVVAALAAGTWMLTGEVTSANGSNSGADQFVANLPRPLDWVDVATHGRPVTYLGQQLGIDDGLWLTEFWNRSIKHVWSLDGTAPGPGPTLTPDLAAPNGRMRFDPGTPYVLADNGVRMIGTVVAHPAGSSLVLYRITHPWRLAETYYGRESDSWIADRNDATYAYFGPAKAGTLRVDVSRAAFCAPTAPDTIAIVRIGPVALNDQRAPIVTHATTTRRIVVHNCQLVPITVRTRAPVAVSVHVTRLVRPLAYGISDDRQLGVQFGASFTPKR
jgi:hypothetical protein